jgi:hypothetical protein
MTVWSGEDLHLALVFTLIEGLGLRQVTTGILHELALSVLAAETVGLTLKLPISPLPERNRLSPSCSSFTWGTYLFLPRHGYLRDCPDGPSLPRRTRPITRSVPTDLPSGDATVARA